MGHGPAAQWGEDKASDYKARLGVYLFIFYVLVYAGFIVINVMTPKTMGIIVMAGLNLACVYGFGLIVLAIVMGLIYNHMCTKKEYELNK
ncbi:MAG: DUF485 domain-containing protein [Deltaproteobacteria bacterium]|nr:DUF485 domain-containing protein [Deltaproteobacteria bacterium]